MKISDAIRGKRIELGLSDLSVAQRAGLSIHEYSDIEGRDDEFTTAIPLETARRVCNALNLNFRALLGLSDMIATADKISDVVREARTNQGMSQLALGDAIGFSEETIRSIESSPNFLTTLPIVVVFDLERVLGIERGSLVRPK